MTTTEGHFTSPADALAEHFALQAPARLQIARPAIPESVGEMRRAIRRFGRLHGAERIEDMALAVSEACSNAVVHAYCDRPRGDVRLAAERAGEHIVVEVRDHGRGPLPRPDSPGLGLGLPTMGTLAEVLDVEDAGPGTRVRLVFSVDA